MKTAEKQLERQVNEHPFGTTMIALAAGVILSQMMGRFTGR